MLQSRIYISDRPIILFRNSARSTTIHAAAQDHAMYTDDHQWKHTVLLICGLYRIRKETPKELETPVNNKWVPHVVCRAQGSPVLLRAKNGPGPQCRRKVLVGAHLLGVHSTFCLLVDRHSGADPLNLSHCPPYTLRIWSSPVCCLRLGIHFCLFCFLRSSHMSYVHVEVKPERP